MHRLRPQRSGGVLRHLHPSPTTGAKLPASSVRSLICLPVNALRSTSAAWTAFRFLRSMLLIVPLAMSWELTLSIAYAPPPSAKKSANVAVTFA